MIATHKGGAQAFMLLHYCAIRGAVGENAKAFPPANMKA